MRLPLVARLSLALLAFAGLWPSALLRRCADASRHGAVAHVEEPAHEAAAAHASHAADHGDEHPPASGCSCGDGCPCPTATPAMSVAPSHGAIARTATPIPHDARHAPTRARPADHRSRAPPGLRFA